MPDEKYGGLATGEAGASELSHFANSMLLDLPKQVAEGKGLGGWLDSKMGGALTAMVEAAGGKQKLIERLKAPGTFGEAAAFVTPLGATKLAGKIPGIIGRGVRGLETAVSSIPRQMALQGASGAVRASDQGNEQMALQGGLSALGGGLGAAAGKLAAKPFAKVVADPAAAEKKIGQGAKASWMATSIPGLGKRELKQFYKQDLGTFGGGERVAEKMAQDADLIKAKGLDDPRKMEEFKEAQPARWQAAEAEMAKLGDNGRLVAFNKDIEALPEVQEYQQVMKETGGDSGELSDIIIGASGAVKDPATGAITLTPQAPRWGGVREHLRSRSDNAYKLSQTGSKDFPDQGRQQQALYKALNSIHKLYTDKSLELLEKVSPGLAKDIKIDWALAKLGDIAEKNTALNVNQFTPEMNSLTGMRMGNLTPGNIAKNIAAKPAQAGLNLIGKGIAKRGLGTVVESADKGKIAPFLSMLPGPRAGATGGYVGGNAMNAITGANGPMTPIEFDEGEGPVTVSPEVRAINMKNGVPDSKYDDALIRGINSAFDIVYRDAFTGQPAMEKQAKEQWMNGMIRRIKQNGDVDMVLASRVFFPQNEMKQSQFIKAYQQDLSLNQAIKAGAFSVTAPSVAGAIRRHLAPSQAAAYDALKSQVEAAAGKAGSDRFEEIMNSWNIGLSVPAKVAAIRNIFAGAGNAEGWRLYNSIIRGIK